jgi:hypothetical protein
MANILKTEKKVLAISMLAEGNSIRSAWSHLDGDNDERTRFVAVLEIPPVESPETAVKVAIAAEVKGKK